jgi:choline dehydrogenase-like flavoprotein/alpha-beta hydrolase superfamily lysophospholipase
MRWLSEGAEVLTQLLEDVAGGAANARELPNAVVVGSGYGGAVAALRLAQAGYKVFVLERGEEMLPGEFPNDISRLPAHLRIERADRAGVIGRRDGLFDLRLHGKVTTLVGNALGGGSQINANVALRVDPEVLRDERWPKELRSSYDPLDAYYTRVEGMLQVAPYPDPCSKDAELARLAEPLNRRLCGQQWSDDTPPRARFYRPPLAVTYRAGENAHGVAQEKCTGCGDCVTGCNAGAKNTLTMNYLPEAKRYGARLFTGVTVVAVKPTEDPANPDAGSCEVQFVYSDRDWSHVLSENQGYGMQWHQQQPGQPRPERFSIVAKKVVLAAGALGSTEILLRSSYLNHVRFSPRLGSGFSGNGDALHFGFDQDRPVNAVGWGSRHPEHANDAPAQRPGPSIVGVLDVRAGLPAREGVLIEDGILPGAIARVAGEVVTTAALLAQLDACSLKGEDGGRDPLAVSDEALSRTQVYLGIGHDASRSELRMQDGRAFVEWREATPQPSIARQKEYLKVAESVAKAVLVGNPAAEPLPASLNKVLSGPQPSGTALVVHPLGGCPMGDHFEAGVVNHLGAVFSGDSPRSVYSALHVWDGAIVPSSLGVNPFLTIAALAERAAEQVLAAEPARAAPPRGELPERPRVEACERPAEEPVAVRFQETMEELRPGEEPGVGAAPKAKRMVLKLRMEVPDLLALLRDPRHRVVNLRGYLDVPGLAPRSRLRLDDEEASAVELMVSQPGGRLWRTLRGLRAWWRKRGRDEALRELNGVLRGKPPRRGLLRYLLSLLRLANHAGERRLMTYRLELRDVEGNRYRLEGVKTVDFARPASTLLHSLLDLDMRLLRKPDLAPVRSARLRLNLVALAEEDLPQVRAASDLPSALIALAGVPLFFARVLLKIHAWDFRAPDYAPRELRAPLPGQRPVFVESVPAPGGRLLPERFWLEVPRGGLAEDDHRIPLALTRFRPPEPGAHATPLLMLPGFAQSARALVCEELHEDLVRHMLRHGFDVWLFDYRTSTALPSAREQCSLDDIARYDIPAAVDRILAVVGAEGWPRHAPREAKPRIMAFGHCMGSATLAMSLLSGRLAYRDPAGLAAAQPRYDGVSKLSAVVLSQVPLFTVPSDYSRYRRELAAFLRNAVGLEHVNFAADDGVDAREMLIDRILAAQPAVLGECPHEHERAVPRTDIATCKRVSGIIGPLYDHRNVQRSHHLMHQYFGWGSMSVFMQITKFFEYHRLVSADGVNHYVTDANIAAYLNLPVALLHGRNNQVFKLESSQRTRDALERVNGPGGCELIDPPGYAHFDCLIGDRAHEDVYPRLSRFLLAQVGSHALPLPPRSDG